MHGLLEVPSSVNAVDAPESDFRCLGLRAVTSV